jgi:hypothetical protein
MKNIISTIAIVLFLLLQQQAKAQQFFDSLLKVAATQYSQEKIHLHFDKTYYNPGETIWFKAYLIENGYPSAISKTMYAELLDGNGTILQRKTMPVFQAGAASFFDLDTVYRPKVYVRAYTAWLLNFDSSLWYLKPITIINPSPEKAIKATPVYTLTLFPEGGDAIENINCRMAFKAVDNEGIPAAVTGTVTDNENNIIANLTSAHNGMGIFAYIPAANETYKVNWKDPNGVLHETVLPTAKKEGIALRINQSKENISYSLNRPEIVDAAFKQLTVIAQVNQQTVYGAKINLSQKTQVTAPIIADSLPDGIMIVTVFNANNIPVAERLLFVNNNSYYFITDLHTSQKDLSPHGKTVLQIDVGANLLSNLSIAVTDAGIEAATKTKASIFSELLLTTDLKGYVYNPAYYFSSDADSVKQQLDLVMLTNGWRRYKWQDILAGKWPAVKYQPDNFITMKGNVYGLSKTQLKDKTLTTIIGAGKTGGSILSIPLNTDGSFSMPGIYFFDTAKILYQINGDKDKRLTAAASFSFNNGFEKSPTTSYNLLQQQYFNLKPDIAVLQKSTKQHQLFLSEIALSKIKTLETVVVKTRQKTAAEKLEEQYASGFFAGGQARLFDLATDPFALSAQTVLDYLRARVAGLQISTSGGNASATRRGSNVAFFLNEMQSDVDLIQNTPMSDVAMVKVFDPPFIAAPGGGPGGAIAVYTKKGAAANEAVKGLNTVTLAGYAAYKEFYMPDYDKTVATGGDYRSTLYWNPFLLMDAKTRRVSIPVFNSSNCKKIKVVIEGINELGQLTREERVFE